MMKNEFLMLGLGSVLLLTACGNPEEGPSKTAVIDAEAAESAEEITQDLVVESEEGDFAEVIEARQQGYKTLGGSFKTIRDNLQAGDSADMDAVKAAAAKMDELADDIGDWFPAGSGPEAGVETEALPVIWEDPAGFTAAIGVLKAATTTMKAAADSGEMAAIGAAVRPLGGACGNCHDTYRVDD